MSPDSIRYPCLPADKRAAPSASKSARRSCSGAAGSRSTSCARRPLGTLCRVSASLRLADTRAERSIALDRPPAGWRLKGKTAQRLRTRSRPVAASHTNVEFGLAGVIWPLGPGANSLRPCCCSAVRRLGAHLADFLQRSQSLLPRQGHSKDTVTGRVFDQISSSGLTIRIRRGLNQEYSLFASSPSDKNKLFRAICIDYILQSVN